MKLHAKDDVLLIDLKPDTLICISKELLQELRNHFLIQDPNFTIENTGAFLTYLRRIMLNRDSISCNVFVTRNKKNRKIYYLNPGVGFNFRLVFSQRSENTRFKQLFTTREFSGKVLVKGMYDFSTRSNKKRYVEYFIEKVNN
jgi:hypothetical protein